jgi:hypothetical protein
MAVPTRKKPKTVLAGQPAAPFRVVFRQGEARRFPPEQLAPIEDLHLETTFDELVRCGQSRNPTTHHDDPVSPFHDSSLRKFRLQRAIAARREFERACPSGRSAAIARPEWKDVGNDARRVGDEFPRSRPCEATLFVDASGDLTGISRRSAPRIFASLSSITPR